MKSHGLTLYVKELRAARFEVLAGPLLFLGVLLIFYVLARQGRIPEPVPIAIAFAPLAVWPLVAIVSGINSLRSEWSGRTIYLISTFPVPGWKILGSKLLSIMTSFASTTLIGGLVGLLFLRSLMGLELSDITSVISATDLVKVVVLSYVGYTLVMAMLVVMSQLAYLVSTLIERFGWVLSILTFFASSWAVSRVGQVLALGLQWLPEWHLPTFNTSNGMVGAGGIPIDVAPLLGSLIVTVGLFFLAARILETESEV